MDEHRYPSEAGRVWGEPVPLELALDFLQGELEGAEDSISRRVHYLSETYSEPQGIPPGEEEVTRAYQDQRALVLDLMRECQEEPLTELFRHRLMDADRQVSELGSRQTLDADTRSRYWRSERERDLLAALLARWLARLKSR